MPQGIDLLMQYLPFNVSSIQAQSQDEHDQKYDAPANNNYRRPPQLG